MSEVLPAAYDSKIEGNIIFTRLDAAMNWTRKNSLWPMPMGLACCAIELMAAASARFDISRFGAEVMRFSPRQCDVMIVAGTVTATPSTPYSPSCTSDAGQSSPLPSSAEIMRATPSPDVQVDERPESSMLHQIAQRTAAP